MTNEEKRKQFPCKRCNGDGVLYFTHDLFIGEYPSPQSCECPDCNGTGIDWQAYAGWLEGENNAQPIKSIYEVMVDSDINSFFLRATGRDYGKYKETCVNDIRRLLMLFWNEKLK